MARASTISDPAVARLSTAIHSPAMSKVDNSSTNQPTKEDAIPGLGVLEEDDEFEEFPVQGEHTPFRTSDPCLTRLITPSARRCAQML